MGIGGMRVCLLGGVSAADAGVRHLLRPPGSHLSIIAMMRPGVRAGGVGVVAQAEPGEEDGEDDEGDPGEGAEDGTGGHGGLVGRVAVAPVEAAQTTDMVGHEGGPGPGAEPEDDGEAEEDDEGEAIVEPWQVELEADHDAECDPRKDNLGDAMLASDQFVWCAWCV